jgi:hypothetical protein
MCGLVGQESDSWWWPARGSGPFVLRGRERTEPKDRGREGAYETAVTVLAPDPLTALKVKEAAPESLVLAAGPGIGANKLAAFLEGRETLIAARSERAIADLKSLLRGLLSG